MSVAERVADERAEKLGKSVGYQIRLEKVQVNTYVRHTISAPYTISDEIIVEVV